VDEQYPHVVSQYGFKCSFNPTFPGDQGKGSGWVSNGYYGLDQGPIILMIENYLTGMIWQLMRRCAYIVQGLRRAEFGRGWLSSHPVGRKADTPSVSTCTPRQNAT
jgi:hypothetical protein